jgi:hypothetical protein
MIEKLGLWVVAAIFVYATAAAVWNREFRYRGGPLIKRQERPVEYWLVTLLFIIVTLVAVAIALLRTLELLPPGRN